MLETIGGIVVVLWIFSGLLGSKDKAEDSSTALEGTGNATRDLNRAVCTLALERGYAVVAHPSIPDCWVVGSSSAGTVGYIHSGNFHEGN